MNDDEKYAVYKQANKTGGPCAICGWRDGDGVKKCFDSHELGTVTHQNSAKKVLELMPPEVRSLMKSYDSLHTTFEHEADHIRCVQAMTDKGQVLRSQYVIPHDCGGQFVQQSKKPYDFICSGCGETAPNFRTEAERKMMWPHKHNVADHSTCVPTGKGFYCLPHSCGKGYGAFYAPYELYCTGCGLHIDLVEYGVDPDMG